MKRSKNKPAKIVLVARWVSQMLLGATFVFSGVVKAIDPLGTTYKIQDYFTAFGPFFEQFNGLALVLSVALSAAEFVVGFMLLLNIKPRLATYGALLFMLAMTPLTLYIALENPVQDCGCFGDAVVISNWATFWKNVVLLLLVVVLLWSLKGARALWNEKAEWIGIAIAVLIPVSLSVYCYRHLPIMDFRPYKIGTNIIQSMAIPEDAEPDVYETTFVYAKDGVEKEFSLADYPDENSGWMFIEQKTVLVKKGFEPPIHDFSMINAMGDDVTYEVLEREGYTFLLIAYDVTKADAAFAEKINAIHALTTYSEMGFYALTASLDEDISLYAEQTNATYEWMKTDPITLKTIVRANPGLVLIKDGVVIGKWHGRDIPEAEIMQKDFLR